MELRQLEHFAAVAKYLSFTRAAREVHVAQSSLSVSVRQLERELEASLFERTTRRVALTPAGRALLPTAQRMLMDVHRARESIAAVSGMLRGQVTVGTIQALTWVDLPAGLSRFHRAHPGVNITLQEAPVDELLDELLAGDLDLAYIARDEPAARGHERDCHPPRRARGGHRARPSTRSPASCTAARPAAGAFR